MAKSTGKKASNIFVWILLGLLIVGLTGFGVRSVGNGGARVVGSVGDRDISAQSYALALNNRIREISQQVGQNITMEQARAFGIDRQVISQLLVTAALDGETDRIGLSVGDERVRAELLATDAFVGLSGAFDQTAYEFALQRAGLTPGEYDTIVRDQDSRALLERSISGGVPTGEGFGRVLLSYLGEERDFTWALIGDGQLPADLAPPNEGDLTTYYNDHAARYTSLPTRNITYISLTPEMVLKHIDVADSELRTLYDSQPDRFNRPERRIVERLVFASQTAAQEAAALLGDGQNSFEDLVASRGLTLDDIDLGDVGRADLSTAGGDAVFALAQPGVTGAVDSALGPAIFRVNAILQAQVTTFEDAKAELKVEAAAAKADGYIAARITDIDDLLAGGATLEEVADSSDMELNTIAFTVDSADGIAAYDAFRENAAAVAEGDFPELIDLADGGILALRLDSETPPALIPMQDVRDRVTTDWLAAQKHRALLSVAAALKPALESGQDFVALDLVPHNELALRREAFVDGAPSTLVTEAFALDPATVAIVDSENLVAVVRLGSVTAFDPMRAENIALVDNINGQLDAQLARDIFQAYADALQNAAGISINQSVINAVQNSGFQSSAPVPTHNGG